MNITEIFGAPIYGYSRAEAIADGELVDLATIKDDKGEALKMFKFPVAMTRGAYAATISAGGSWIDGALKLPGCQDVAGRLWDVLWMLSCAIKRAGRSTDRVYFTVLVNVNGQDRPGPQPVKLWALMGPGDNAEPVITIILEGED